METHSPSSLHTPPMESTAILGKYAGAIVDGQHLYVFRHNGTPVWVGYMVECNEMNVDELKARMDYRMRFDQVCCRRPS